MISSDCEKVSNSSWNFLEGRDAMVSVPTDLTGFQNLLGLHNYLDLFDFSIFAQVSFSDTVRLKMGLSSVES